MWEIYQVNRKVLGHLCYRILIGIHSLQLNWIVYVCAVGKRNVSSIMPRCKDLWKLFCLNEIVQLYDRMETITVGHTIWLGKEKAGNGDLNTRAITFRLDKEIKERWFSCGTAHVYQLCISLKEIRAFLSVNKVWLCFALSLNIPGLQKLSDFQSHPEYTWSMHDKEQTTNFGLLYGLKTKTGLHQSNLYGFYCKLFQISCISLLYIRRSQSQCEENNRSSKPEENAWIPDPSSIFHLPSSLSGRQVLKEKVTESYARLMSAIEVVR